MYKINNIPFTNYGIIAGEVAGESIALKGCFDLPKRIGDTDYSWADEDGVQPFVDADEIFLDAREIEFAGLILATKTAAENQLNQFKALIATFTDLVLLETPYGSFSAVVKTITAKIKEGVSVVKIVFTEPEVGKIVGVLVPPTTYYSAEYSETAIKNDCAVGYAGSEVILTAEVGLFTSILSQAAADQLAIDWVRSEKQVNANNNGLCTLVPTIYYNVLLEAYLQKNNCKQDEVGSFVRYVVLPYQYSSLISQADADAKAQAEVDAVLTQSYANTYGTCIVGASFPMVYKTLRTENGSRYKLQVFEVRGTLAVDDIFYLICYGVKVTYTVLATDTAANIVQALADKINAVAPNTAINWNEQNQAPLNTPYKYPPEAALDPKVANYIVIAVNENNLFTSGVE